jgi:hypothetical protein
MLLSDAITTALIAAGGTVLGAGLTAIGAYVLYWRKHKDSRKDAQEDKSDNVTKALRYLMLYVIEERGKELVCQGYATFEERRSIHHWHDLYHKGLGGNGDADRLMECVNALPYEEGTEHDTGI